MIEIFILLMLMQVKHYFADYVWQFPYMYENKGKPKKWMIPLAHHAGVHGAITFVIMIPIVGWSAIFLAIFDFITHFAIDRWKATKPFGPNTSEFWLYLGKDQMFHHIVTTIIVFAGVIWLS